MLIFPFVWWCFGRIPRRPYSHIDREASAGRRGSGFPGVRYRSRALLHAEKAHDSFVIVTFLCITQTTKPLQSLARSPQYGSKE